MNERRKLMPTGTNTLIKTKTAQISHISPFGLWILIENTEYFIDFKDYPYFYKATLNQILDFSVDICGNFHWESLDIDIEKESLDSPEKYPLIYRA